MPQIPTYQPKIAPQSQPYPRLDPRLAGAAAGGLIEAGTLLIDYADKREKAQRAIELGKATNGATRELEQLQLDLENDPDYASAEARWQAGAAAIRDKYAKGFSSDPGRAEFAGHFDKLALGAEFQVKRAARKKLIADAEAVLDDSAELQSRRAANATNPLERDAAVEAFAKQLGEARDAGILDPNKAGDRLRAFRSRVAETAALRDANADPEAAAARLTDPGAYADLDPKRREGLIRSVQARADAVQRERIAAADRAERRADRQLRRDQAATEADIADRMQRGESFTTPQLSDLLRQQKISPEGYRFLREEPNRLAEGADNPRVVLDLQDRMIRGGSDIHLDILRARAVGNLSRVTAGQLMADNQGRLDRAGREEWKTAEERDWFNYIGQYLGQDKLMFAFDDDTAQRVANAKMEYRQRLRAPVAAGAAPETPEAVARDIVARYANRIAPLPPSSYYAEPKSQSDIIAAGDRLRALRDGGQISPATYAREMQALRARAESLPAPAPKGRKP